MRASQFRHGGTRVQFCNVAWLQWVRAAHAERLALSQSKEWLVFFFDGHA
jgi:hypothetical protein